MIKRPRALAHVRTPLDAARRTRSTADDAENVYRPDMIEAAAARALEALRDGFDPAEALAHIETYRITHSQWVPTMFIRMLKLDERIRTRFDLSSHQCAIHAAAPCPVEVKHRMMDWWGPILWEYYAGTERNGHTVISPEEWLAHPGSVGSAHSGVIHICDEEGAELPTGEAGMIYFEQPARTFEYHNAPDKTASATHATPPRTGTSG